MRFDRKTSDSIFIIVKVKDLEEGIRKKEVDLGNSKSEEVKLQNNIRGLKKDIEGLKKEIQERDETIQDKVKFCLVKKNIYRMCSFRKNESMN